MLVDRFFGEVQLSGKFQCFRWQRTTRVGNLQGQYDATKSRNLYSSTRRKTRRRFRFIPGGPRKGDRLRKLLPKSQGPFRQDDFVEIPVRFCRLAE